MLGDLRLPSEEVDYFDSLGSEERPHLSAISLWEVATLVDLGRLELEVSLETFLENAASRVTVRIHPITSQIVLAMNALPKHFHRDPADRLIVGTARAEGLPLATRDQKIMDSACIPVWSLKGKSGPSKA